MKLKKGLSLVFSLVLVAQLCLPVGAVVAGTSKPEKLSADNFTDIKGHGAEESIKFVVAEGLFYGISDTDFAPDKNMTRGMLVTVLYRQAGSPAVETEETTWYSSARAWAMKAGICDGANMERDITRQELVTMLHRFAKQMGIDVSVGEDTNILSYNDAFDLPQWSIPAFQWACGSGVLEGAGENLFYATIETRAQAATMLQRFAGLSAT
ncbi:MAG: S-layer homology domain-containing protein [Oscillospiraceae bacterium]